MPGRRCWLIGEGLVGLMERVIYSPGMLKIRRPSLFTRTRGSGLKPKYVKYQNKRQKLSKDQIQEIRRLHATGKYSYSSLGGLFNVSATHISSIVRNKSRM